MTSWKQIDPWHWESNEHMATVGRHPLLGPAEVEYDGRVTNVRVHQIFVNRKDRKALGVEHFGVLQSAKNAIFGPEYTAVEVYPPEEELRDRANVYWLHVFGAGYRPTWLQKHVRSVVEDLQWHS
jgi:hypothetical protein